MNHTSFQSREKAEKMAVSLSKSKRDRNEKFIRIRIILYYIGIVVMILLCILEGQILVNNILNMFKP